MGLSEKLVEIKAETEALTEYANGVTGASDIRLGDAVRTLADGFGQGGGGYWPPDDETPANDEIFAYIVAPAGKPLTCALAINGSAKIDWGDGSSSDSISGLSTTEAIKVVHQYSNSGHYRIKVFNIEGSYAILSNVGFIIFDTGSTNALVYGWILSGVKFGKWPVALPVFMSHRALEFIEFVPDPEQTAVESLPSATFSQSLAFAYRVRRIVLPRLANRSFAGAFQDLHSAEEIWFSDQKPRTASSGAFQSLPASCKIYVPSGTLSAYTSAANYPSPHINQYIEYDL